MDSGAPDRPEPWEDLAPRGQSIRRLTRRKGVAVTAADVLVDAFGRIREVVHDVVDGLTPDQLSLRLDGAAN
jgi:hypothetical protein